MKNTLFTLLSHSISSPITHWKGLGRGFFCLLLSLLVLASCSETEDEQVEFADWQNTNESYFNSLYSTTQTRINSGDTSWKIIKGWNLVDNSTATTTNSYDHIIVEVLEEGTGSGSPLYTDSVLVHYSGSLLPSLTYTSGFIFDQSWQGEFSTNTAIPAVFKVSGTVDGFATALQNMHIGDHWRVYIPYQLGYGTSTSSSSIPSYSTLIFDLRLVGYGRSGAGLPTLQ